MQLTIPVLLAHTVNQYLFYQKSHVIVTKDAMTFRHIGVFWNSSPQNKRVVTCSEKPMLS